MIFFRIPDTAAVPNTLWSLYTAEAFTSILITGDLEKQGFLEVKISWHKVFLYGLLRVFSGFLRVPSYGFSMVFLGFRVVFPWFS